MSDPQDKATTESDAPIVVKFTAKYYCDDEYVAWRRQLPDDRAEWGRCRFVFDQDCRTYDWLAVYDDLAPVAGERFSVRRESLACPREHTILLTTEPSAVKAYGSDFLDQFGVILTSQEPWAIPQKTAVYTQPGIRWFYGRHTPEVAPYDRMMANPPTDKTRVISTVCSAKHHGDRTLHRARIEFTERLQEKLPQLDRFGRGVRPVHDKIEALDPYRYHVTIENHIAPHYWTEKLSDPFLGMTLPFYQGCPNAEEYFPERSFIRIDIRDFAGTLETIERAIADDEYEKRLPDLREARRRVLEQHNVFAGFSREIEARHDSGRRPEPGAVLFSRRALRRKSPIVAWRSFKDKLRVKLARTRHRS